MGRQVVKANELLGNELVLRAAWVRLETWYRTQEWRPEPDLTRFRLELPERLAELAEELRAGIYRPTAFRLLPYPKGPDCLRHYCLVSAKDQLAFAVFGVLLGPYIDLSLPNHVFGNRWYRGMKREIVDGHGPRWRERAFSLDAVSFYLPYRRDYGLFRRVASWSAAAMVGVARSSMQTRPGAVAPSDYASDRLPSFVETEGWGGPPLRQGHWVRLDLRLAYPSVRGDFLAAQLESICVDPTVAVNSLVQQLEFPKAIAESLQTEEVRVDLARRLAVALGQIEYIAGPVSDSHWMPSGEETSKFPTWRLPNSTAESTHRGLPTGLAIAGLLFNAYLRPLDSAMAALRESRGQTLAYLRFADDMVVLGRSAEDVRAAIETLESFQPGAENDYNIVLNTKKVKPDSWKGFAVRREDRQTPKVPKEELLSEERLEPFVTYLVERMSEIGNADPRFGDPARRHLIALHELIRLKVPDDEVKDETRLAFAANRIAKAFLPVEAGDIAAKDLDEIAESVRIAMRNAPHKFFGSSRVRV